MNKMDVNKLNIFNSSMISDGILSYLIDAWLGILIAKRNHREVLKKNQPIDQ